jgi:hypothetical protein
VARQFEWESSNTHISYPFEPQVDPIDLQEVFADAIIMDGSGENQLIRMHEFDYGTSTIDLRYLDGTTFLIGAAESVDTYGDWAVMRFADEPNSREAMFLINVGAASPYPVSAVDAVLVARVVDRPAARVRTIEVTDGVTDIVHVLSGDVEFVAGYNMVITPQALSKLFDNRNANTMTLSIVAGAGMGRVPSECEPDGTLKTINGVGPDDSGNVNLTPRGCYRYVRPEDGYSETLISILNHRIVLYNDCYPCCECEDYSRVYKGMDRLYNRGRNIGLRFSNIIGTNSVVGPPPIPGTGYKGLRDDMEEERSKRAIPAMDIFLRPSPGYIMGVQLYFKNNRPGVSLNMDELNILFRLANSPEGREGFDATLGELIPDSIYVLNSSDGSMWAHRTAAQVFPELVNFQSPVDLKLTYTPEPTEEEPEPPDEPVILDGTQYIIVFFEIYFGNTDVEDGDFAGAGLESPTFLPNDLVKFETLIKPFDGDIESPEGGG